MGVWKHQALGLGAEPPLPAQTLLWFQFWELFLPLSVAEAEV